MDFEGPQSDFEEVDCRYAELKRLHEAGAITQEEFDEQLKRLMFQDESDRWWAKSRKTGEWHYHDGRTWVRGTPVNHAPASGVVRNIRRGWRETRPGDTVPQDPDGSPTPDGGGQRPPGTPDAIRNRKTALLVAGALGILLLLLASGVAIAIVGLGGSPDPSPPPPSPSPAPPSPSPAPPSPPSAPEEKAGPGEEELRAAVRDYYAAVDREDWSDTYDALDSQTKQRFTRDEWVQKNEFYADNYPLRQTATEIAGDPENPPVLVNLTQTFEDSTVRSRPTYFVVEDGSWKHRFSPEEYDHFMADATFEQFAQAKAP